jgi:hypothetical protein
MAKSANPQLALMALMRVGFRIAGMVRAFKVGTKGRGG